MLNQKFFQKLGTDYQSYEAERHHLIKESNDALVRAKQAIFSLHRDETAEAQRLIQEAEAIFKNLESKFKKNEKLKYEGAYRAALEEYVEAKLFFGFLTRGRIDSIKEIKVEAESYLGGLCDLTGELVRKSISLATQGKFDQVEKFKIEVELIMKELIKMNLTGYLRTKYDQAKNNLRKIEEVLYEVKMRRP